MWSTSTMRIKSWLRMSIVLHHLLTGRSHILKLNRHTQHMSLSVPIAFQAMRMAPGPTAEAYRVTRAHVNDKASRWKLSGARSTVALADDAQVVSGPGSVPLGRWHGPDGHDRSGRCGRSEEARERINLLSC